MKIASLHSTLVRIPQKPPITPYQSRYPASSEKESLRVLVPFRRTPPTNAPPP